MNKEQLEVSKAIVELSKTFLDQVRQAMNRVCLLDDGYSLDLSIRPFMEFKDGTVLQNTIDISNGHCDESFCVFKYMREGWKTLYEPETDTETESTRSCGDQKSGAEGRREEAGKPFAPDGLWLTADYDPDNVPDWWSDVT